MKITIFRTFLIISLFCSPLASASAAPGGGAGGSLPRIGYMNYAELAAHHPLMGLWENNGQSFTDSRGVGMLSEGKIKLIENMRDQFKAISQEEMDLIPLMNLKRKEWQAEHPNASDAELRAAYAGFEEEFFNRKKSIEEKKYEIEAKLTPIGFTTEDLLFKREQRFDEVTETIYSDIKALAQELKKKHNLEIILDSSPLDSPRLIDGLGATGTALSDKTAVNLVSDLLTPQKVDSGKIPGGLLSNPPEQRAKVWYQSRDFLLQRLNAITGSVLLLRGGMDLTGQALKTLRAKYPELSGQKEVKKNSEKNRPARPSRAGR